MELSTKSRKPSVLIVDDEPAIGEILRHWLMDAGYPCHTVQSGMDALELLDTTDIEVVIADWLMPGMDGIDLCRILRSPERTKSPYFLLITGNPDPHSLQRAFEEGVDDFLSKPLSRVEFLSRLRAADRIVSLQADTERRSEQSFSRQVHHSHVRELREVVATLSHDLRTPLGALRSTAETLVINNQDIATETLRGLERMVSLSTHMADLLNDLEGAFGVGTPNPVSWVPFDLREQIRRCGNMVRSAVPPGVGLRIDDGPALEVVGDPTALRRMLVNLLSNALRHTTEGEVRIGAGCLELHGARCILLRISDSGEGISPNLAPHLGEPMLLLSPARRRELGLRGAGLGLLLCRRLAARFQGRIRIESTLGKGTTISVFLLADLQAPAPDAELCPLDLQLDA